ncbi:MULTISPECIES: helix-turn-helix domain-containing protein [Prolixibacter]|uniref:Helix-turn-helix protein n=2 Tax=Prolixibacter TaxID=314318 RepID=A0A2P8CCV1_9BACT|nr:MULTISPECIES: helix-turn-helix domain-containing protein [Prolixibacter]PSK82791.1 helix-turn-helix protein [Prolixibacter denitrificans]GET21393.1 transcriptional regulator [Prolixibacter denitrificans]GET31291.1 transcriptional regulator [Prolixibacter bellariivorans]
MPNERNQHPENRGIYREQLVTTHDLQNLKEELLSDFRKLLKEQNHQPVKKWLKSYEVRKLLNISPGTLQNLRINGTLPYTKIGGVIYYEQSDIQQMLESRKTKGHFV